MMWNIAGIRLTRTFIEMGLMHEPLMCEFTTFGEGFEEFGHPATIQGLQALVDFIPEGAEWHWMISCIGANPFPLYAYAIAKGGHVAVGLGDHPYPEFDLPSNAQLVERVVQMARQHGSRDFDRCRNPRAVRLFSPIGKAGIMATATHTPTSLSCERVSGNIGAWVRGFELDAPDNAAHADMLQRALAEHGVLFFDFGRIPDFEEYHGFAGLFRQGSR